MDSIFSLFFIYFTGINVTSQMILLLPKDASEAMVARELPRQTNDSSEMILMDSNDFLGFVFNQPQSSMVPRKDADLFS